MPVIGRLAATVTLNSAGFTKGISRLSSPLVGFGKSVLRIGKQVAQFGAVVGTAAAAGFAVFTAQAFQSIDALAKSADKLGLTTEALAGFQLAAQLGGVEAETMEKALGKMSVQLAGAARGTGPAAEAIEAMGLSVGDLLAMSPEQQFGALADGIAGFGNQADKAAAANALFGRSGIELLPVLNQGSAGLAATAAEAEALGLSISRVDAAKIEQSNDAITKLKSVFKGVFQQVAIQVAPAITHVVATIVELTKRGGGMGAIVSTAFGYVADGATAVLNGVSYVQIGFSTLQKYATIAIKTIVDGMVGLAKIGQDVAGFFGVDLGQSVVDFGETLSSSLGQTISEIEESIAEQASGPKLGDRVRTNFAEAYRAAQEAAEATVEPLEIGVVPDSKIADVIAPEKKESSTGGGGAGSLGGAVLAGSAEAVQAINRARFGIDKRSLAAAEKNAKAAEESLLELRKIVENLSSDVSLVGITI